VYHPLQRPPPICGGGWSPVSSTKQNNNFMITTKPLALGLRQGEVAYVRDVPSQKMKLFATIVQFWKEVEGEFGKTRATEGFFGIALTSEKPNLNPGEKVNVEIVSYQSGINPNDPTGRENLQARCLLISRVKENETPARVQAAEGAGKQTTEK
jgi:hypothetical protein